MDPSGQRNSQKILLDVIFSPDIQIVFQLVGQKLYGAKLLKKVVFVQRLDADASLHISSVYNNKWNSRISR